MSQASNASGKSAFIPVVLLAYARPDHLAHVLECLRENRVPLIHAFCDGPKGDSDANEVARVRALLRAVDWCELHVHERESNLGLGQNVIAGVSEVAYQYGAFIVWEDDLICVPGTYDWVCAALRYYANDERVFSVSAWTHPRVTPSNLEGLPYFDGRAECWVWGGYARAWRGMDQTAEQKMEALRVRGVHPSAYGSDLPLMAKNEAKRNTWAVRWLYHHLQHAGLCLRPPWSMVEHIGFDQSATNAATAYAWKNPSLRTVPAMPLKWPEPIEHPECRRLWRHTTPGFIRQAASRLLKMFVRE